MNARSKSYDRTRAALIRSGTTLRRWAKEHQLPYTTVVGALRHERHGVKAVRARQLIHDFLYGNQTTTTAPQQSENAPC